MTLKGNVTINFNVIQMEWELMGKGRGACMKGTVSVSPYI